MNVLYYLLDNMIELVIIYTYLLYNDHIVYKKRRWLTIPLIVCISYVNMLGLKQLNLLVTLFMTLIISLYIFHVKYLYSVIFTLFYTLISVTCNLLLFFIIIIVSVNIKSSIIIMVIYLLISGFMKIIILYYYKPLKQLMKNKTFFKTVYPLLLLPIGCILSILLVFDFYELHHFYVQIGILLLFFLTFLLIYIILKVNESAYLAGQLNALKANENINQSYYQMIDEKIEANRVLIHDMNKHLNILNTYIMNKDYDTGIAYISTMQKKANILIKHAYSGNKLLDVVIHSVENDFNLSNIYIQYERVEDFDYKSECLYDLNAILYNVLENAVESCILLDGGIIHITFKREQANYVIFKVVNTAIIKGTDILNTKKYNKDHHGIGIYSIKEAVVKLGGSVEFSYDDDLHLFTTIIYIKYVSGLKSTQDRM